MVKAVQDFEEDEERSLEEGELLVRSYGLHWMRDSVDWNEKELLGHRRHYKATVKTKTRKEKICDVWNQRGIYALYQEFKLVYVGMAASSTGNIGSRLKWHTEKPHISKRWDSFSWFGVYSYDDAGQLIESEKFASGLSSELIARTLELVLILVAEPPLNRSRGRFRGSEQVNQAPSKEVVPTTERLDRIEQLLSEIRQATK